MQNVHQNPHFVYNFCQIYFLFGVWLQENQKDQDKDLNQVHHQNLDSRHVSNKHNHISGNKLPYVRTIGVDDYRYFAESEFLDLN